MKSLGPDYKAIVFGATGGIGQAISNALQQDPSCKQLVRLGRSTGIGFDLTNEDSLAAAAEAITASAPFQLMIDATGVLSDEQMQPEKSLNALNPEHLARAMAVNAIGPALLLKHFSPLLDRRKRAIFASLSARVGSIGDNRLGGWYGYRASKAALNQIIRTAGIEIARKAPEAVVLALHPGTVDTSLSRPFGAQAGRFSPDQAAGLLLNVMDEAGPQISGGFLAYDGAPIPF